MLQALPSKPLLREKGRFASARNPPLIKRPAPHVVNQRRPLPGCEIIDQPVPINALRQRNEQPADRSRHSGFSSESTRERRRILCKGLCSGIGPAAPLQSVSLMDATESSRSKDTSALCQEQLEHALRNFAVTLGDLLAQIFYEAVPVPLLHRLYSLPEDFLKL